MKISFASLLFGAALFASACGGNTAKTADLAGIDLSAKAPDMAGFVQGCGPTSFVDHTTDSGPVAVTPWDLSSTAPRCLKISIGQTVTWAASSTHPLISIGGDANSPISATPQPTPQSITFPTAGTFGFWCNNHQALMEGAIFVVAGQTNDM